MAPTREKFLALTFLTVLFFALSALKARAADPSTNDQCGQMCMCQLPSDK
jgi:hypothetical protein